MDIIDYTGKKTKSNAAMNIDYMKYLNDFE